MAAKEQGFDQIARLFEATSAAEQIHIGLEAGVIAEMEPGYERPAAPEAEGIATDLNLIAGVLSGRNNVTQIHGIAPSDSSSCFGHPKMAAIMAEMVFTRAKLAEAVHAELYMDAYNNIDAPTDEAYYLGQVRIALVAAPNAPLPDLQTARLAAPLPFRPLFRSVIFSAAMIPAPRPTVCEQKRKLRLLACWAELKGEIGRSRQGRSLWS